VATEFFFLSKLEFSTVGKCIDNIVCWAVIKKKLKAY